MQRVWGGGQQIWTEAVENAAEERKRVCVSAGQVRFVGLFDGWFGLSYRSSLALLTIRNSFSFLGLGFGESIIPCWVSNSVALYLPFSSRDTSPNLWT